MSLERRLEWAARLGIVAGFEPEDGETATAFRLRRDGLERAMRTLDAGRMRTMLGWADDFAVGAQRAPFFRDLCFIGDVENGRYNARTLQMFEEFVRAAGSKKRGREGATVRADGIQAMSGMMRMMREMSSGCEVVNAALTAGTTHRFKDMRKEDGASGTRKRRRALRTSILRKLAAGGIDRTTAVAAMEWAAALIGSNALLRGGEVGRRDNHPFQPQLGLTWGKITWCAACPDSRGRRWMTLWVVPIKDQNQRHQAAIPIPIVRRQVDGELGGDSLCAYDALEVLWRRMVGGDPPVVQADWLELNLGGGKLAKSHPMASKPIFAHPNGAAICTEDVRRMARRFASAAGEDPADFGASVIATVGWCDGSAGSIWRRRVE